MSWLRQTPEDLYSSAKKKVSALGNSLNEMRDRRTLERALNQRKETARDYEQNRVPAGHDYYKLLYDACMADLTAFCTTYGHDLQMTTMQYPFLYSLQRKAYPETQDDHAPGVLAKAFGGLVAAGLACFLIGAGTGLFSGGQQLVTSFFV